MPSILSDIELARPGLRQGGIEAGLSGARFLNLEETAGFLRGCKSISKQIQSLFMTSGILRKLYLVRVKMRLNRSWQIRLAQISLGAALVIALVVVRGTSAQNDPVHMTR